MVKCFAYAATGEPTLAQLGLSFGDVKRPANNAHRRSDEDGPVLDARCPPISPMRWGRADVVEVCCVRFRINRTTGQKLFRWFRAPAVDADAKGRSKLQRLGCGAHAVEFVPQRVQLPVPTQAFQIAREASPSNEAPPSTLDAAARSNHKSQTLLAHARAQRRQHPSQPALQQKHAVRSATLPCDAFRRSRLHWTRAARAIVGFQSLPLPELISLAQQLAQPRTFAVPATNRPKSPGGKATSK
mmetsp:Transcript_45853/g.141236  ORF Transcript_45853/g.141236 Transcript_45853/m.141236 type:complete len:243 (-) Transcript_45853:248-976(-)